MRSLADLKCPNCENEFYADLPTGQGLYTPILLDKNTGAVYDDHNVGWYAEWLETSYKNRVSEPLGFEVRKFSDVKDKVILLNCLDVLYGHSLLKLLNAQHYINFQKDFSLILIVPPFLEWMLPNGAAEAWIVDLRLREGTQWNDWLAEKIGERLASFSQVFLSEAFSHPHPNDFDIERFTGIAPFALEKFESNLEKPSITYIWREDRLWETPQDSSTAFEKVRDFLTFPQRHDDEQRLKVIEFAELLREKFPQLDFAVAGIGQNGDFPDWISDMRLKKITAEDERVWCERYAKSHLVVGVHGSNLLLPSAHAGGVIELISADRQANYLQDILFRKGEDTREALFRYRFLPHSTTPEELAQITSIILRYEDFRQLMSPEFCRHQMITDEIGGRA